MNKTSTFRSNAPLAISFDEVFKKNTPAVLVILLVTLIASQDFLLADFNSATVLREWWVDASFHIVNINALSDLLQSHGQAGTLETGAGENFYHFLPYLPSALGCAFFGMTAIQAFALLYAPLAVFLFVLGIWLLASVCWTKEQALWATVMLMLLPDFLPYVSTSHDFLRIKWLVSVSPGLGYGVFVSALAWIYCLRGIRENALRYVVIGFALCLLTILVKAHMFVANALPLVVFTIAFFPALKRAQRLYLLVIFFAAYGTSIWLARNFLSIPLIWPDFSNATAYASTLLKFQPLDFISTWLLGTAAASQFPMSALVLALALIFMHFGALFLLTLLMLGKDLKRGEIRRWLPALFIFSVYILHAVSLASDTRPYTYTGSPIELIHRPLVWGVSLVMIWTMASLAANFPSVLTTGRRWVLIAVLLIPSAYAYHNMQFAPYWLAPRISYSDPYFEALGYLESTARRDEVVQAADLDPYLVTRAVSGHKPYVSKYSMQLHAPDEVSVRSAKVLHWLQEKDSASILSFARQSHIDWLIAYDSSLTGWSPEFVAEHTRFQQDGVLVLRF